MRERHFFAAYTASSKDGQRGKKNHNRQQDQLERRERGSLTVGQLVLDSVPKNPIKLSTL